MMIILMIDDINHIEGKIWRNPKKKLSSKGIKLLIFVVTIYNVRHHCPHKYLN